MVKKAIFDYLNVIVIAHEHIVGVVQSCTNNAFAFSQQVVDVLNNILEENNLNGWMDLQEVCWI